MTQLNSTLHTNFDAGSIPDWLLKLLPNHRLPGEWSWVDHVGIDRVDGEEVFVTRPYRLTASDLNHLYAFAEKYRLSVAIYAGERFEPDAPLAPLEIRISQPQPPATANGGGQTLNQSAKVSNDL